MVNVIKKCKALKPVQVPQGLLIHKKFFPLAELIIFILRYTINELKGTLDSASMKHTWLMVLGMIAIPYYVHAAKPFQTSLNPLASDSLRVYSDSSSVWRVAMFRKRSPDKPKDLITIFFQNKSNNGLYLHNGKIFFRTQKQAIADSSRFETATTAYIVAQSRVTAEKDYAHQVSLFFLEGTPETTLLRPDSSFYVVVHADTTESSEAVWNSFRLTTTTSVWSPEKGVIHLKMPSSPHPVIEARAPQLTLVGPDFSVPFTASWDSTYVYEKLPFGSYSIEQERLYEQGRYTLDPKPGSIPIEITPEIWEEQVQLEWLPIVLWTKMQLVMPPQPHPNIPAPRITVTSHGGYFWQETIPWGSQKEFTELLADSTFTITSNDPGYNFEIAQLEKTPISTIPLFDKPNEVTLAYKITPFSPEKPATLLLDVTGLPAKTRSFIRLANDVHVYTDSLSNGPIRWENLRPGSYEATSEAVMYPPFTLQSFSLISLPDLFENDVSEVLPVHFEISDSNLGRFAPFADASLWPPPDFNEYQNKTNLNRFVMGFIVNDQNAKPCTPKWGGYTLYSTTKSQEAAGDGSIYLLEMLRKFRKSGGHAALSFGGALGTPIEKTCPDAASLSAVMDEILRAYDQNEIDFDIEGDWIADEESLSRRIQALVLLQKKRPMLKIWLTLPVLPSGLTGAGQKIVQDFVDAGIRLMGLNIMAMNYGESVVKDVTKLDLYAIQALDSTFQQVKAIFQKARLQRTDEDIWHMLGVTPMIGINNVEKEVFKVSHGEHLATFAKQKGLGLLSMWSIQRDFPCQEAQPTSVSLTCSGTTQTDFAFTKLFSSFRTDGKNLPIPVTQLSREEQPLGDISLMNFPNPFSQTTQIAFELPMAQRIRLTLFDVLGRERMVIAEGVFEKGLQRFTLKAGNLASGYYFLRLEAHKQVVRRPILLIH